MSNKEKYSEWCKNTYIPIFSKPYWMDAVCGEENWDVWLYESGGQVLAAMPYYIEKREIYNYITKPPLTQNNGILFEKNEKRKLVTFAELQEKVINEACDFINSLKLDVYEQQYHYSFRNWLPFFWNHYTAITRYTYVLEDLHDLNEVWQRVTSKQRSIVKKGYRNAIINKELDEKIFYKEHEKVFLKQGLACPFSFEQWESIYKACVEHNAGQILCARTEGGEIASLLFLIWDEQSVYHLIGGSMPGFQNLETYSALTWEGIKFASEKGLNYDFEGSVIKRISKSFREFGGEPKPYFRIRKVFNPEIIRKEADERIEELWREK